MAHKKIRGNKYADKITMEEEVKLTKEDLKSIIENQINLYYFFLSLDKSFVIYNMGLCFEAYK